MPTRSDTNWCSPTASLLKMVEEHGVDYVLGKGPSSKDSSPATRLKGSMQQSVAASARIAPDPAEVDNILDDLYVIRELLSLT